LIQILRIKNLIRAVPLFPAQMAARINSVSARLTGPKWTHGVARSSDRRGKNRRFERSSLYPALTLSSRRLPRPVPAGRFGPIVWQRRALMHPMEKTGRHT
jgi:hypothetical protein